MNKKMLRVTGFLILFSTIVSCGSSRNTQNQSPVNIKPTSKYKIGDDAYRITDKGSIYPEYDNALAFFCGKSPVIARIYPSDPSYVYFEANNEIKCVASKSDLQEINKRANTLTIDEIQAKRKSEERFKKLTAQVSKDIVAQVLNYSSGYKDTGSELFTWVAKDSQSCVYQKVNVESLAVYETLNLNDLDPRYIKIGSELNTSSPKSVKVPNYDNRGRFNPVTVIEQDVYQSQDIKYMGRTLFSTTGLDLDRLKRGWKLIYSNYCSGTKKAF